jgi:acid phosphatase
LVAVAATAIVAAPLAFGGRTAALAKSGGSIPSYDHVFLIIDENHNYNQIIGNPAAPDINALANDYGLGRTLERHRLDPHPFGGPRQ